MINISKSLAESKVQQQSIEELKKENDLNVAIIGNCQVSALIDSKGRYVWSCFPRFDSSPFFSFLVNPIADYGYFDVKLTNFDHSKQEYIRNTAIVKTTLYDSKGCGIEILDFAPRYAHYGRMFHPSKLVRIIRPIKQSDSKPCNCQITVRFRPSFNYCSKACELKRGSNHIHFNCDNNYHSRLTSDLGISFILEEVPFVLDEPKYFILGLDESLPRAPHELGTQYLQNTKKEWQIFVKGLTLPYDYQDAVIRAAITLKICQYEESGGIVAAMTSSIPEAPNTSRCWDYRYCWLRDSYHTVRALNMLGSTETMVNYLEFIKNIIINLDEENNDLQPLYTLMLGTNCKEWIADIIGYRGIGPVRFGNEAYVQRQNDNYGSVVLALTQYFFDARVSINPPSVNLFYSLERLGHLAVKYWDTPDAGLWELRGYVGRIHTFSAVMCWAACDRLGTIASKFNEQKKHNYWKEQAKIIRTSVMERAWDNDMQSFISVINPKECGLRDLDASLLLLAELRFIDPKDNRFIKTVEAIQKKLQKNKLMSRYVIEDDIGVQDKTSFGVCNFWLIDALYRIGKIDEARTIFKNMLSYRNHVGLLSEDIAFDTGELWGNIPQTFVLAGIIKCAMHLSRTWESQL